MKSKQPKEEVRRYWLWVTRPEYYLDKNKKERRSLDPASGGDLCGTWTCSQHTKKGDLVLLWRTKPKSDIAYLFQAKSDAFENEEEIHSPGWQYYCEMIPVYKFKKPLTISDIRSDPYLEDWGAFKARFFGSHFEISPEIWDRLNNLLIDGNPGYQKKLEGIERRRIPIAIAREEEMEHRLAKDPGILRKQGYHLELIQRQMICIGAAGRLDLLFRDTKKGFVVVELKNVKADQNTFGQICSYVGWVKEKIAGRHPVQGLVISRGKDPQFANAMKTQPNVLQLDIGVLGFK